MYVFGILWARDGRAFHLLRRPLLIRVDLLKLASSVGLLPLTRFVLGAAVTIELATEPLLFTVLESGLFSCSALLNWFFFGLYDGGLFTQ